MRCLICASDHFNACPMLWGGTPELPAETDEQIAEREAREACQANRPNGEPCELCDRKSTLRLTRTTR